MQPPLPPAGIEPSSHPVPAYVPGLSQADERAPRVRQSTANQQEAADTMPAANSTAECRVLHVVNGEHFSGAERVQSHLGRCLPQFGVTADFVCVKPGQFANLLREHGGKWGQGFEFPMRHRVDLRAAIEVRDLVRSGRYDLLHAHTPRTAMIAAIAGHVTGTPWIYHVHSPASRDSEKRWSNRINDWIERLSLRGCAHRITVSESLRRDCLLRGTKPETVTVVHNGVPAIRPVRVTTPTPGGRWTLGMVALMRPRKGLEVVLDALALLRAEGHDAVLRCIGPFETADYESEIDQRIARLNLHSVVERQGFTSDVPVALGKIDAMVLPSLYGEGLPMVVLEAMAAGLPVVATAVEGTPEAIRHGEEGLLAEPRDPASLADCIRSLMLGEYDWQRMSEAAAQRHQLCFSDVAMAQRTAAVYRQVLNQQPVLNR